MGRAHKRPQDIHAIGVMSEGNVETSSRCHIAEQSLLMDVNTQNINTQNINSEGELRNYLYGDNAFTVEKNDLK